MFQIESQNVFGHAEKYNGYLSIYQSYSKSSKLHPEKKSCSWTFLNWDLGDKVMTPEHKLKTVDIFQDTSKCEYCSDVYDLELSTM